MASWAETSETLLSKLDSADSTAIHRLNAEYLNPLSDLLRKKNTSTEIETLEPSSTDLFPSLPIASPIRQSTMPISPPNYSTITPSASTPCTPCRRNSPASTSSLFALSRPGAEAEAEALTVLKSLKAIQLGTEPVDMDPQFEPGEVVWTLERVLDETVSDKVHRQLAVYLKRCAHFLVQELSSFGVNLECKFSCIAVSKYAKSRINDHMFNAGRQRCSALCSLQDKNLSLNSNTLFCLLESIVDECKDSEALKLSCKASWSHVTRLCELFADILKVSSADISEDTIQEVLRESCTGSALVHCLETWFTTENLFGRLPGIMSLLKQWIQAELKYSGKHFVVLIASCANKCLTTSTSRSGTKRSHSKSLLTRCDQAPPVTATGLHYVDCSMKSKDEDLTSSGGAIRILLDDGGKTADFSDCLYSLESYLQMGTNDISKRVFSTSHVQKDLKDYLLHYFSALEFLFHSVVDLVNLGKKHICAEKGATFLSSELCVILGAFRQLHDVFHPLQNMSPRLRTKGTSIVLLYNDDHILFMIDSRETHEKKNKKLIINDNLDKFRLLSSGTSFVAFAGDVQFGEELMEYLVKETKCRSTLEDIVRVAARWVPPIDLSGEISIIIGGWTNKKAMAWIGVVIFDDLNLKYKVEYNKVKVASKNGWIQLVLGSGGRYIKNFLDLIKVGHTLDETQELLQCGMCHSAVRHEPTGGVSHYYHFEKPVMKGRGANKYVASVDSLHQSATTKEWLIRHHWRVMELNKHMLLIIYDKNAFTHTEVCGALKKVGLRVPLTIYSPLFKIMGTDLFVTTFTAMKKQQILGQGKNITGSRKLMCLLRQEGFKEYESGNKIFYIGSVSLSFLQQVDEDKKLSERHLA